jgi:hypothetical protein
VTRHLLAATHRLRWRDDRSGPQESVSETLMIASVARLGTDCVDPKRTTRWTWCASCSLCAVHVVLFWIACRRDVELVSL